MEGITQRLMEGITQRLMDRYNDLQTVFETPPERVVERLAENVSSKSYLTVEQAFRRFLAERSLALELSRQQPYRLRSMLEEKTLTVPRMDKSTRDLINVLVPQDLPKANRKSITDAMAQGLKYLVIERSFSPPLLGLSAILAMTDRNATRIGLVNIIRMANSPQLSHLKELATYTSSWMLQAQTIYDTNTTRDPSLLGSKQRFVDIQSCSDNIGIHWEQWRTINESTENAPNAHSRLHHESPPTIASYPLGKFLVVGASVDKLYSFLGDRLLEGVLSSHTRRQETLLRPRSSITGAVRLRLPPDQHDDFKVEIWLSSSMEQAIRKAVTGMGQDLIDILGDYLFYAMKSSRLVKEERGLGALFALSVADGNGDVKLGVIIDFRSGLDMFNEVFPPV